MLVWRPSLSCMSFRTALSQLVSFSIHIFTQNSFKAAKAVSTAKWGSPGNKSHPISLFINQSTLQALDGEQCPPRRDAMHQDPSCKWHGTVYMGSNAWLSLHVHTQLQECCSSNVKCVCGVTFSVLITVDMLPGKSLSGRAVTEREKYRVPKDRALSFLPHSASPLLDFSPLFSNKPSFSLLLTCLFVCVTSIHNNIIIRLRLKPLSPFCSLFPQPPLPRRLGLAGSGYVSAEERKQWGSKRMGRCGGGEKLLTALAYQTHGEGWGLGAGADVDLHIRTRGACVHRCVCVCEVGESNGYHGG